MEPSRKWWKLPHKHGKLPLKTRKLPWKLPSAPMIKSNNTAGDRIRPSAVAFPVGHVSDSVLCYNERCFLRFRCRFTSSTTPTMPPPCVHAVGVSKTSAVRSDSDSAPSLPHPAQTTHDADAYLFLMIRIHPRSWLVGTRPLGCLRRQPRIQMSLPPGTPERTDERTLFRALYQPPPSYVSRTVLVGFLV